MTAKKIFVICKYNQARSIVASAALRNFFPEHEIISAGIIANSLIKIPTSIITILGEWGLEDFDQRSTALKDLLDVSPDDLILCADSEVFAAVEEWLQSKNREALNLQLFEDHATSAFEIPVDPVNMNEIQTRLQLARSVALCVRAVRKFLNIPSPITGWALPQDRAEHKKFAQQYLAALKQQPASIIDLGFSIPNSLLWPPGDYALTSINPRQLQSFSLTPHINQVLISKFEISQSPQILLSKEFLAMLLKLSEKKEIFLLAPPLSEYPPNRHHELILGLLHG